MAEAQKTSWRPLILLCSQILAVFQEIPGYGLAHHDVLIAISILSQSVWSSPWVPRRIDCWCRCLGRKLYMWLSERDWHFGLDLIIFSIAPYICFVYLICEGPISFYSFFLIWIFFAPLYYKTTTFKSIILENHNFLWHLYVWPTGGTRP